MEEDLAMKYTVELEPNDTEVFRQLVTEAYGAGKNWHEGDDSAKARIGDHYGRLLERAKVQAEMLARRAFAAGHQTPRMEERGHHV